MLNSFCDDACRLCTGPQSPPNSSPAASFPEKCASQRCNFRHFTDASELIEATSVSYRGTARQDKIPASIRDFPLNRTAETFSMTITAAHIQPIVALIAGIIILIMPRFLNLIVAIYLIFVGLAGLGLFKMFKM
jgi:hypothetical protein